MSIEVYESMRDTLLSESYAICHDRFEYAVIRTHLGYGDFLEPDEMPASYPALLIDLKMERLLAGWQLSRVVSSRLTYYDQKREEHSLFVASTADPEIYENEFSVSFADVLRTYRQQPASTLLIAQVSEAPKNFDMPYDNQPWQKDGMFAMEERHAARLALSGPEGSV